MDLLLNLEHTKVNSTKDFDIIIEKIDAGWMDLRFGTTNNKLFYSISYLCDPLEDILETSVLLLQNKPMKHSINKNVYDFSYCTFELESKGTINWIFRKIDNNFYIYSWLNNLYEDDIIDLYNNNCDSEQLEKYLFVDYEDFPDLNNNLLFAIECKVETWNEILMATFKQLTEKYNQDDFLETNNWGIQFNKENLEFIKNYK